MIRDTWDEYCTWGPVAKVVMFIPFLATVISCAFVDAIAWLL